jgi:methionine sulfoxide reductase heme-binding subunit
MSSRTSPGPAILYGSAMALLATATALAWLSHGVSQEALASVTRHTARIAFVYFFVTFTASVWFVLRSTPVTRWLLSNRRHLGLSFAFVHVVHLLALASLFAVRGEVPDPVTLVGGGLAYVLLALLVLTSNRAARIRLGRRWRTLHLVGCWYLWAIFTQSYLGRLDPVAGAEPYIVFVALSAMALAVPVLRSWAFIRRRTPRPATPVGAS